MVKKNNKNRNVLLLYFVLFYFAVVLGGFIFMTARLSGTAKESSQKAVDTSIARIGDRISTTVSLVTTLAKSEAVASPDVAATDKARFLSQYAEPFGYMRVGYLDDESWLWDEEARAVSLADRGYVLQMFLTGEVQINDVLPTRVDGSTLSYMVAAPILSDGKVTGAVLAVLYYDEVDELIEQMVRETGTTLVMFGSDARVMHYCTPDTVGAVERPQYNKAYTELAQQVHIFGSDVTTVEADIIADRPGDHWGWQGGGTYYLLYKTVPGTSWTVMARMSLGSVLGGNALWPSLSALMMTGLCVALFVLVYRYYRKRMQTVNTLLESVQKLERQIYQTENPGDMDFKQIIKMTGKGLTDGLTGVVTRTVFMDRVSARLAHERNGLSVLCFVDADDLKITNDTYGHETGDAVLKEIGYMLRKYEKRYDGMVGRYGGDEFVLYLTGFADMDEVAEVIDELTEALRLTVTVGELEIPIHCSVGATVCGDDLTGALKIADAALYEVKRNEKGSYKLL